MHTWFHFIPPWVMGFLTICLILSTNKRAGGLLRQCHSTLEWARAHNRHTHVYCRVYTCPNVHSPQKAGFLPIESFNKKKPYVVKKLFHPAVFHKSNREPHLSFFLSSVSNLHWPLGYVLEAEGFEGYVCSGTIYCAVLLLETWQNAWG